MKPGIFLRCPGGVIVVFCTPLLLLITLAGCSKDDVSDDDTSPTAATSPTPGGTPADGENTPTGDDDSSLPSPTPAATPVPTPAPTPFAESSPYVVLVPDNGNNRFLVVDPFRARQVYEVNLAEHRPDLCRFPPCFVFAGHHHNLEGEDYLDLSYGLPLFTSASIGSGFQGNIERIQMTKPPTLRWRLHELDFSGMPGGASAYCPADPADPCKADPSASPEEQGLCWISDAHDFRVLSDDPVAKQAELVVVDTDSFRMLKATLDYAGGNTCGQVTALLDSERNPAWYPGSQPNNLVPIEMEGHELYLVNQRSVIHATNADGDGMLQLWELEADNKWTLHWTFPEQPEDGELRVLRIPHGGHFIPGGHPEGDLYLFADSASLSDTPEYAPYSQPGGSAVAVLIRDTLSPPDYLYDIYQPVSEGVWSFPRDIVPTGDGSFVITDSGCIEPDYCPEPGRLIFIDGLLSENSSKEGYWTPDHAEMDLIDDTEHVVRDFQCGFSSPYSGKVIPAETFGTDLETLSRAVGTACP